MNSQSCGCGGGACGDSACGCCDGIAASTPVDIANRPGLPELRYRVGTHGRFLASMQARLPTMEVETAGDDGLPPRTLRPLQALTTRDPADPAIALLDAWATVADVLTFYQERIANEGYVRTATERRSLVEMARLVGYAPRPGVSSSVFLSYTVDDNQAEPVDLPVGTRAQSLPGPDETPQSFETDAPLQARREWNDLSIRRERPQSIDSASVLSIDRVYVKGVDTGVQSGELLLFQFGAGAAAVYQIRRVVAVETDFIAQRSAISLQPMQPLLAQALSPLATLIGKLEQLQSQGNGNANALARSKALQSAVRLGAPHWPLAQWHQRIAEGVGGAALVPLDDFDDAIKRILLPLAAVRTQALALLKMLIAQLKWRIGQGEGDARAVDNAESLLGEIEQGHQVAPLQDWDGVLGSGVEEEESIQLIQDFDEAIEKLQPSASGPATSSPDEFVEGLLRKPAVQVANPQRLRRDLRSAFGYGADLQPQLITDFAPRLKDNYYQAWRGTEVKTQVLSQRLVALYSLGAGEALFGAATGRPMPEIVNNKVPAVQTWGDWLYAEDENDSNAFLGKSLPLLAKGDLVLVTRPGDTDLPDYRILTVDAARTGPRNAYGISGESTELEFGVDGTATIWRTVEAGKEGRDEIHELRRTWLHPQRKRLLPVPEPILDDVSGATLELGPLHQQLQSGRWVVVEGERSDIEGVRGVRASELMMVAGLEHGYDPYLPGDRPHTTLHLATALANAYYRDGLRIHANVVPASHGETRREVLGSSDARQPMQRFSLRQPPLTFRPAPTAAGAASTLKVLVDGVEWQEAANLSALTPDARAFVTLTGDDGVTQVIFGDGEHGLRPPSGFENLRAEYRNGIGGAGNVRAGQISLLISRPLGIKDVVNPLRASGGADRETLELIRENAPRSLMALDRLVSLSDYADFTRMFAGIAKADAVRLGDGTRELVHITVAGVDDMPIDEESDLYRNLLAALRELGDPALTVQVAMRERLALVLQAKLRLLPGYRWEPVSAAVRERLLDRFGFHARAIAQPALLCELVAAIQSVRGIDWVDVDSFGAIPETVVDYHSQQRRLITQGEITDTVREILDGDSDSNGFDDDDETHEPLQPPARVDAGRAEVEGERIRPARLAFFAPAIPDTLILNPVQ
ncbi:putative baseplate assembly protein [Lysobacter sp. K5869]|uniref:putative baseplate assembly protein n=1 Tax=Lysobacter sp. K5869 TaxID=2820808 RepID=UPI001C0627E8|nr:putative baseplate assembly protein [Lysobacter sp. K5869]QWP78977.1 putative baseplate assembly protein [Lysobacter sp. K5869]